MGAIRSQGSRTWSVFGSKRWRWPGGEPIEMRERRYRFFPKVFVSRGHRYDIHAIERCWTMVRRERGERVERLCFRVRCREGSFDLYQDVRHNTWHLQRQVA